MAIGGRGYTVIAVAYLFLVLSTISVFLRCYVRIYLVKRFGLDDHFAVLAWALFMVNLSFVVTAAYHGTGQHFADLPPEEIPVGLKWWWLCEPVFVLASMAIKFSIGYYLIHIAQTRLHKAVLWTAIVIMELYSLFFFFIFIFQCQPSEYFWTQFTGAKGKCISTDLLVGITYAYSGIACLTDWLYAIMPAFILWNLKIDLRTKISVGILMALGASASITTVIRIPYLKSFRDTSDFLFATTDVALWTTAELGIGISAACLATIRPLVRQLCGESPLAFSTSNSLNAGKKLSGIGYIRSGSRGGVEEFGMDYHVQMDGRVMVNQEVFVDSKPAMRMGDVERGAIGSPGSFKSPLKRHTIGCAIGSPESIEEVPHVSYFQR